MSKYCRARQATDESITRHMRNACWVPKATDTRPDYVILIALPLQQWLNIRGPLLYYKYIILCLLFIVAVQKVT